MAVRELAPRHRAPDRIDEFLGVLKAFALRGSPGERQAARPGWQPGIDVPAASGRADSGDIEIDLVELFTDAAGIATDVGTGIALFIDEMQDVQADDVSALCAACHELSQTGAPLIVVGAGLPHLPAVLSASKSYSERLFRYQRIDRLDRISADHALTAPADREGVEYESKALDALYEASGGYPYFVQAYGKATWDHAPRSPITAGDVRVAAPEAEAELGGRLLRVAVRAGHPGRARVPAHAWPNSRPTDDMQGAVSTAEIAKVLGRKPASLSPARDALIKKGLIYSGERGTVAFTVPHFGRYLRSQPGEIAQTSLTRPARSSRARPLDQPAQVAALDRRGHHLGERVGRAGERRHPERRQRRGVLPVVVRRAVVVERQQHDHLHAGGDQRGDPAQHLLGRAALVQVADQHQDRVARPGDQALGVGERAVDVGAAAQLGAEQHLHRVGELLGEVDDRGVEHHQRRPQRPHRRQHRGEDAGVHHRTRHRPGLVDAQHHLAVHRVGPPAVPDQPLRESTRPQRRAGSACRFGRIVRSQSMSRCRGRLIRAARLSAPVTAARVRWVTRRCRSSTTLRDDLAGGAPAGLRHHPAQREQRADQVDVGLDRVEHLRLQQQPLQAEPLDRVGLHDLHHRRREVPPDVAEPAGHPRRRRAEIAAAPAGRLARLGRRAGPP